METAKRLLGGGKELNDFVARLLDDIGNLKAMLQAISIGERRACMPVECVCARGCWMTLAT